MAQIRRDTYEPFAGQRIHMKSSVFFAVKYWKQIGICSKIYSVAPGVQAVFLAAAAARANLENNEWKVGISDLRWEAW